MLCWENSFENFLGTLFRGEYGQYFTRRQIVEFMVAILDPDEHDLIMEISFELERNEIMEKYGESAEFNAEETIASERFFKEYRELEYMIRDKLEKFAKEREK